MGACQKVRQMTFEHCLVTARDQAGGVSAEIGKLDDKASKSRACPSRRVRPDGEILEKLIDDALGRAGETQVLACKVIVQRPLRDGSECRDLIHAHAHESLATE